MFMDTFQGYYKDGTNGTYDWRFLAGLYPLLRIGIVSSFEKMSDQYGQTQQHMTYCFIVIAVMSLVRPYKKLTHNLVEILLLILIAAMVCHVGQTNVSIQRATYIHDNIQHAIMIVLLLLVPHLLLALAIIYKLFHLLKWQLEQSYNCRLMNKIPWLDVVWSKLNRLVTGHNEQTRAAVVCYGTI